MTNRMKAVYTSDLHGEIPLYEELLSLAHFFMAEIAAVGGDLLPSFPPTRRYEDMVPNQKVFIDQFLLPFFERMIRTTTVRQIFLIPGNWDLGYFYLFRNPTEGLIDICQKHCRLKNGYEMIGYPFVPPTPFRPKDFEKMDDPESPWPPQKNPSYIRSSDQTDLLIPIDPLVYLRQRETIREDLDHLARPKNPGKTVYVMHSPPFKTNLDQIIGGRFTGSRSIRRFIEETQPLLTLHGHIHEAPEISGSCLDRIGKTLCVNPGQFRVSGRTLSRLHAITFELENLEETLQHTLFAK
ncbi:MAG TPA: metallophosphoesterase [Thermodesulfobacteriota bacterium]|nr:metallophosphoesterase [Thermodesulfobacteriota bacterium]